MPDPHPGQRRLTPAGRVWRSIARSLTEGSIPYNQEVKATYRVKNVGDQPLALQPPTVDVVEGC